MYTTPPLSPFPIFSFLDGGGEVEIGMSFVQIEETAFMWRIAYLGVEPGGESKFRNFQNSFILRLSFSLMILICWHSKGT